MGGRAEQPAAPRAEPPPTGTWSGPPHTPPAPHSIVPFTFVLALTAAVLGAIYVMVMTAVHDEFEDLSEAVADLLTLCPLVVLAAGIFATAVSLAIRGRARRVGATYDALIDQTIGLGGLAIVLALMGVYALVDASLTIGP